MEPITQPKIRQLLDEVDVIIRGLKAAGEKIDDTFSRFICYIVSRKLDKETKTDWENSINSTKVFPIYNELQKFLQNRLFAYEESICEQASEKRKSVSSVQKSPVPPPAKVSNKNNVKSSFVVEQSGNCAVCNESSHPIYRCSVFLAKSPRERLYLSKANKLCIICLSSGHSCRLCLNSSTRFKCRCGDLTTIFCILKQQTIVLQPAM